MNCPFCSTPFNIKSFLPNTSFIKKIFNYIKYTNCKLIILSPFPNKDDYEKLYPISYQNGANSNLSEDYSKKLLGLRFTYKYHFDLINKYMPNEKVLEYVCGDGHFINNSGKYGIKCDRVEYNQEQVDILNKTFLNSNFKTIDAFYKDVAKYSVIRLSNVLEHIENTVEIIKKLKLKLKSNGIFIVEGLIEIIMNLAFIIRFIYFRTKKIIQPNWIVSHNPTHIFFSNRLNQMQFFRSLCLKTLDCQITEAAWSFPEKIEKGLVNKLKWIIARISMLISSFIPNLGNTFIYLGKKNEE